MKQMAWKEVVSPKQREDQDDPECDAGRCRLTAGRRAGGARRGRRGKAPAGPRAAHRPAHLVFTREFLRRERPTSKHRQISPVNLDFKTPPEKRAGLGAAIPRFCMVP